MNFVSSCTPVQPGPKESHTRTNVIHSETPPVPPMTGHWLHGSWNGEVNKPCTCCLMTVSGYPTRRLPQPTTAGTTAMCGSAATEEQKPWTPLSPQPGFITPSRHIDPHEQNTGTNAKGLSFPFRHLETNNFHKALGVGSNMMPPTGGSSANLSCGGY